MTTEIVVTLAPTRDVEIVLFDERDTTLDIGTPAQVAEVVLSEIFRGLQGNEGPPGEGAGPIQTINGTADVALGGHRVVGARDSGLYGYVDAAAIGDSFRLTGVTRGAADAGQPVSVQTKGIMTEPSWNWTADQLVYLGANGLLTQAVPVKPQAVFAAIVGFALTPTSIFVNPQPPIYIA